MKKLVKSGFAVITLAILAACGGGGGGGAPSGAGSAPSIAEQAQAVAGRLDALLQTAIPTTAAAALSIDDGCFLNNGNTKAMLSAEIDADIPEYVAANAYRIGSTRTNIRVTAERNITNADGSARTEADVLYDINYTDGSKDIDAVNTVVTGSTTGLCATPQNSAESRFLGNQRIVGFNVRARNVRNEQYNKTTGALLTQAVTYNNGLQFNVTDPQGLATYAVVTGPGTATVSGVATTFSIKLVSTRLLKDDPFLAGKPNNFTNWKAADAFRICRAASSNNQVPASAADCLNAGGNSRGVTLPVPTTGLVPPQAIAFFDTEFVKLGFVVGGTYTVKIYNDAGWKTVNGEAGKAPIATYIAVNETLPYTFAQMVGGNGLDDHKFAKLVSSSLTPIQTAAALSSSTPGTLDISWTAPAAQSDGRLFRFTEVGEFFQGAKTGNLLGAFNPAERYYKPTYFTGNTTAANGLAITSTPSSIVDKSYSEFSLNYTDRNNARMISLVTFQ